MPLLPRSLRRSVLCLLGMGCAVFAARSGAQVVSQPGSQFINQLTPTLSSSASSTGPVASLLTGSLQGSSIASVDILYIDAPVVTGAGPSVLVGEELNAGSSNGGLSDANYDQITFNGATNVVAALPVIQGTTDYAFAITGVAANNLCFYSFNPQSGSTTNPIEPYYGYSYSSSSYVPENDSGSGCMTLPHAAKPPNFTAIAALTLNSGTFPQLVVEDSANDLLYVVAVTVVTGATANLALESTIPIAPLEGPGPIYAGDFNGDGNTDFIVNGQTSHSATVYLSNGFGGFTPSAPLFSTHVYSMLMQNMGGSSHTNASGPIQDMVVEDSDGSIKIFKGNGDGTFQTTPEGGTGTGNSLTGDGGRLAAIDPNTLDILTATPIGLSVLQPQGPGSLNYSLYNIYNIGPGRSSFALANFRGGGFPNDLAVNSPEGVAIARGDGNGGFQTSLAYSALAPALGATVAYFRDQPINPDNCLDVVAATGSNGSPIQGQLLMGNANAAGTCDGTFTTFPNPTITTGGPSGIPSNLWSNIFSGQFNGEPNEDIVYALTGLPPLPTSGSGLYIQYGNGDGTFNPPVAVTGESSGNTLYGDSIVCILQNLSLGATEDIANADAGGDETLLAPNGSSTTGSFNLGLDQPGSGLDFNHVAAGGFKVSNVRSSGEDLVFQNGAELVPYRNNDYTGNNFTAMPPLSGTPPLSQLVPAAVLLSDMNGDGNSDVVVVYYPVAGTGGAPPVMPPSLYIWWGNGDGTFKPTPFTLRLSRNYYLAAAADMNGDGYPDLVLSDGSLVGILYNQGQLSSQNGQFVSDIPPPSGPCPLCGGEQQFLAGQGINSLSLVRFGSAKTPSLIVANGGASISNPLALAALGQTSLPANPPDVDTGGITVLANVVATTPATGTLTSSPSTSNIGASFTMTATFSSSPGVPEPSGGIVTFYFNGTQVPGCSLGIAQGATSSTATCTVPTGVTTAIGTFPISAAYSGDGNNSASTASASQTIAADPTTTTLLLCVGPTAQCPSMGVINPAPPYVAALSMIYGQTFNGITQVTAVDPSTLLGTTVLNDVYNGAPPLALCTLSPLSNTPCPPQVGTGTQVGVNVFTSSYVPGANDINGPSTSLPATITVTPDTVNATVSGTPSTAPVGQPVTLTATLAGPNAPLGTAASPVGNYLPPLGTVIFLNGTAPIACSAPATLVAGATGVSSTATCTTSSLPAGTDLITVTYAGSLNFQPTTSATPFSETIAPLVAPSFTLVVTPNPVAVTVGYGTLLSVTVTPQNGFSESVNLACGTLPSETTCTFTQPAIAGGGGQSNLILETTAPHNCGATQPYFFGGNGGGPDLAPLALPALAGIFALFIPGRRRWLRALLAVAVVASIAQIVGCGTCTDLGTRPNTYTIQVIGTSTVTGEVQSQALTLNATI